MWGAESSERRELPTYVEMLRGETGSGAAGEQTTNEKKKKRLLKKSVCLFIRSITNNGHSKCVILGWDVKTPQVTHQHMVCSRDHPTRSTGKRATSFRSTASML